MDLPSDVVVDAASVVLAHCAARKREAGAHLTQRGQGTLRACGFGRTVCDLGVNDDHDRTPPAQRS